MREAAFHLGLYKKKCKSEQSGRVTYACVNCCPAVWLSDRYQLIPLPQWWLTWEKAKSGLFILRPTQCITVMFSVLLSRVSFRVREPDLNIWHQQYDVGLLNTIPFIGGTTTYKTKWAVFQIPCMVRAFPLRPDGILLTVVRPVSWKSMGIIILFGFLCSPLPKQATKEV